MEKYYYLVNKLIQDYYVNNGAPTQTAKNTLKSCTRYRGYFSVLMENK